MTLHSLYNFIVHLIEVVFAKSLFEYEQFIEFQSTFAAFFRFKISNWVFLSWSIYRRKFNDRPDSSLLCITW